MTGAADEEEFELNRVRIVGVKLAVELILEPFELEVDTLGDDAEVVAAFITDRNDEIDATEEVDGCDGTCCGIRIRSSVRARETADDDEAAGDVRIETFVWLVGVR